MTFQELMDCYHISAVDSNRYAYELLKEQIKKHNVTPVIGAGFSMWAEYPSWKKLLIDAAQPYGMAEQVENCINDMRYDDAAEIMEKFLGQHMWNQLLKNAFDPTQIAANREKRPIYQLLFQKLFQGTILTTNFDRCIEDLYQDMDAVNPSDIFQTEWINRSQYLKELLLIKLHGDIRHPEQMVLTTAAYNKFYGDNPLQPDMEKELPKFLSRMLGDNPLLFLGCSLQQDRTCAVIRGCASSNMLFALLPLPTETKNVDDPLKPILRENNVLLPALMERKEGLRDMQVFPIWYPSGMADDALSVFFEKLAKDCGIEEASNEKVELNYHALHELVGRDETVEEIGITLSHKKPRCVWVQGPAGIGKTEICRAAYSWIKKRHSNWEMPFVDVTGVNSSSSFFARIESSTDIKIPENVLNVSEYLITTLVGKFLQTNSAIAPALYFDNWEDVWRNLKKNEKEHVAKWLQSLYARGVSFLFSSQTKPPDFLTTTIFKINPLDKDVSNIESLSDADFLALDSVKLFQQVYADKISQRDMVALRKLIAQLEGHPLAIVLTATQARTSTLGFESLLNRWDATQETFGIKKTHRSLDVALGLAWDAVSSIQEAVLYWVLQFYSVSPIPSSFHAYLLDSDVQNRGMDILNANSLLRVDREHGLVGMLLPLKKQLPKLLDKDSPYWQKGLLIWAKALTKLLNKADDENQLDAHLQSIEMMPQACHIVEQLMRNEGDDSVDYLLALIHSAGNHFPYCSLSEDLLRKLTKNPEIKARPKVFGFVLRNYGDRLKAIGKYEQAEMAYIQAEQEHRQANNQQGLANTLRSKGDLLRAKGDAAGAQKAYDEAENLYRERNDSLGLANTLQSKGNLMMDQPNDYSAELSYKEAESLLNEAESIFRSIDEKLGLANTLLSKGDLMVAKKNYTNATTAYAESEQLYRQLQDRLGLANVLQSKGDMLQQQGKHPQALLLYREALTRYQKLEDVVGCVYVQTEIYRCLCALSMEEDCTLIKGWLLKQLPKLSQPVQEYVMSILECD